MKNFALKSISLVFKTSAKWDNFPSQFTILLLRNSTYSIVKYELYFGSVLFLLELYGAKENGPFIAPQKVNFEKAISWIFDCDISKLQKTIAKFLIFDQLDELEIIFIQFFYPIHILLLWNSTVLNCLATKSISIGFFDSLPCWYKETRFSGRTKYELFLGSFIFQIKSHLFFTNEEILN